MSIVRAAGLALAATVGLAGCGAAGSGILGYGDRIDGVHSEQGTGRLAVRWTRPLAPDLEGPYMPIERTIPALDPAHDRIYVGSSAGQLWCFNGAGTQRWMYQAGGGIGVQPVLSQEGSTLYVGSDDGFLHALRAEDGTQLWQTALQGALGRAPIVTADALYLVTDNDVVEAFDRATGEALWRFERQAPEGFYVTEHAGLALADRRLITGFTDGTVVAFDPSDGRVLWTRDTTSDLQTRTGELRFTDVDTTPVILGETVYVASFAGGLYALQASSGTVEWLRREWTGVVSIAPVGAHRLILGSGDVGIVAVDRRTGEAVWRRPVRRGSPTSLQITADLVIYGESDGGLVARSTATGREVGRVEDGHGFGGAVSIADGLGGAVSNTGTLFVFAVR